MGHRLLIHNALINGTHRGWVSVHAPFISAIGYGDAPTNLIDEANEKVDAAGAMLLPGAIDAHVHFREPGLTHKASIASESRAALAGGVTSFIEMPNTVPPTTTLEAWRDKMERAECTSAINYAFMLGATADNIKELCKADARWMPAVKVFMGSSTGNMLLEDENVLRTIFSEQPFRVVVHAEDQDIINALSYKYRDKSNIAMHSVIRPAEACVRATERAMELATRYGTRLHIAHISTKEETRLLGFSSSPAAKQITAEVSPHHLVFSNDDYSRLGARIKMNPSVKTPEDRAVLRAALEEGRIDIVATDHAPHLLSEKEGDVFHAVSGAPMVQFSLPVMLDLYDPAYVVMRMCTAPAILFGIERRGEIKEGYYADLTLVDKLSEPHTITDKDVVSACGWTPLTGYRTHHRVIKTFVNGGNIAYPLSFA